MYKLVNYIPGDGGKMNCDLCGMIHTHQYWIENIKTKKIIECGSDCAIKILGIKDIKKQGEEFLKRKQAEELNKLIIEESAKYIEIQGKRKQVETKIKELREQQELSEDKRTAVWCAGNLVVYVKLEKLD